MPAAPPLLVQVLPRLKIGGVEKGVLELAGAWAAAGGEGWVVCQEADEAMREGVTGRLVTLPVATRSPWGLYRAAGALKRELGSRPAILLSHSRAPNLVSMLVASGPPRRPWVAGMWGLYRPHFLSRQLAKADRVWVASTASKAHATERLGVPPAKVRLHPRGVRPDHYHPLPEPDRSLLPAPPNSRLVLGVGRLTATKGVEVLLDALALLEGHDPPVVGAWLGPVEGADALRALDARLAANADLAARFAYLPATPDPRPRYAAADIAVVLAHRVPEAFGRVAVEAMACGLPVVAAAAGGPLDVVQDGLTGFLVAPGDAAATAAAISRLAKDPHLAGRMGEAGRRAVHTDHNLAHRLQGMVAELQELSEESK